VLPIIIYLFVLALGTDYNILMTARIREEHDAGNAPRQASALAIHHGAPTVAAAGLILAGTFASLALSGTVDGLQEGFALAVGILLTSYVMASVMVPSIAAKLGDRMWWPSKKESVQPTPELLYIEPEEVRMSA
jgi:putative drug exporter of the RND superfamily